MTGPVLVDRGRLAPIEFVHRAEQASHSIAVSAAVSVPLTRAEGGEPT